MKLHVTHVVKAWRSEKRTYYLHQKYCKNLTLARKNAGWTFHLKLWKWDSSKTWVNTKYYFFHFQANSNYFFQCEIICSMFSWGARSSKRAFTSQNDVAMYSVQFDVAMYSVQFLFNIILKTVTTFLICCIRNFKRAWSNLSDFS